MRPPRPIVLSLACAACLALAACGGIGAGTVARDRFDYVASLSESAKRESLLNLVKIRYADSPVFLNVASVINAYSWEVDVTAAAQGASPGRGDQFFGMGAAGRYADKPTITYAPLTGDKFARHLMAPIPVTAVLYLLQSGQRADIVMRVCVSSINGLDNAYGSFGNTQPGSERFPELLAGLRRAQEHGRFDMRLDPSSTKKDAIVMVLRAAPGADPGARDGRLREMLGLDAVAQEYSVVQGAFSTSPREVAIMTRSMMQVMTDFASYIEVPAADIAEGRVYDPERTPRDLERFPPLMRVRSGAEAPADAFVAIRYRGRAFWIDDRDVPSKTSLNFLLQLFSLTETGTQQAAPIVTVPTR
jgi:hypothetical protein